jgi:hypothetical protein
MAYNASSVVDFLTSRGVKPQAGETLPLFDVRKNIYGTSGLQLGDYRGTKDQNTALLNYLTQSERNAGVSINAENLYDVIGLNKKTPATDIVDGATGTTGGTNVDTRDTGTTEETGGTDLTGQELPADILEALYGKNLSSDELAQKALEKFTGDSTYGLKQEESESDKVALQLQAQADKESFIKKIASQGLIFSGAKKTGLASIDADAIAKQFGIDRKFALYVTQGLESAAQDIAKEASKGNADALASLRSLGYDVNPLTGRIEQTLAARKADVSEQQAEERLTLSEAAAERAEQQLELSRLSAERAEESAIRAEERLNLEFLKYENEQDKETSIIEANANDIIDGTLDLSDVEAQYLNKTKSTLRGYVKQETSDMTSLQSKLKIANQLGEATSLTDDEIRMMVMNDYSEGKDLKNSLSENSKLPISNQDRVKLITNEIYNPVVTSQNGAFVGPTQKTPITSRFQGVGENMIDFSNIKIPSLFRF